MKTRHLLAGLAAIVMLPGLVVSDANADHRRHWFFDFYNQYENDAYAYNAPGSRLRLRQPGYENRDPLLLYEEGYISEREYRRLIRAERRKERRYRAKRLKAERRWRERVIHRDQETGGKPRKLKQLANVPLPRARPFDEDSIVAGDSTTSSEATAFDHDPMAVYPIEPVTSLDSVRSTTARTETAKLKLANKTTTDKKVKGRISCSSAEKIIAGYGFTDIEAKNCNGKSYGFAAQRDGKPFSITLSSVSGELTEVKRN